MHENEFHIDTKLVKKLINDQFPEFSTLSITPVNSIGTVNAIYRLGDEFCVRLPRVLEWSKDIPKEWQWLPWLAPHLSLKIPEPVALGQPSALYPVCWAIYKWMGGQNYADALIHDEREAACQLADFVNELHAIDVPIDAPRAGRRPLQELSKITIEAFEAAPDLIDTARAIEAWEQSCRASVWNGRVVWIHADLLTTNLLVESGRLNAVIDFGSAGVGDPAFDLIPAWSVFNLEGRKVFVSSVSADNDMFIRARGYALHQAALIIPYYRRTYPQFVTLARRTISEILSELDS